ncbi:response regulator transcription factor [Planomicrobium okeanokoites]|uniref:response regulator transcription factor n=1 Tax=Planomicrobium okeanokoites TaxID=244 RepID=UPI000A05EA1B|nr:response regulator transcription factor [Planomicrobium okeanokoites]
MEIHIIGNVDNKKKRLNLLLAEHYPKHDIINQESVITIEEKAARNNIALLIIILTNKNVNIVEQLFGINDLEIPILFVEEEDTDMREDFLHRDNVKGYIRRNAPLEKIKSVMNLVLEGGIYKEPTVTPKVEPMIKSKKELQLEWTILSMHSKGFEIKDICEVVKLTEDAVNEKLKKIKSEVLFDTPTPVS